MVPRPLKQMVPGFEVLTSWREGTRLHDKIGRLFNWFAIDNCAFSNGFNESRWMAHLKKNIDLSDHCKFVVAPDVVGDWKATMKSYAKYDDIIRSLGYKVAFVAQDDQPISLLPDHDCLFIGGSTKFKYSGQVVDLVERSKSLGKWTHVGRVNTSYRMAYCRQLGVDSVDGTHLAFAPKQGMQRLKAWMGNEIMFKEIV